VEFFADKVPYVDSVWDVVHTFIRIPAGVVVAYAATSDLDPSISIPAALIGGGFAFASHGTKAAARMGANLSPEPVSNWVLSIVEDVVAFVGSLLAVFAPIAIAVVLVVFLILFFWIFPKFVRAIRRIFRGIAALFRGEPLKEVAAKAS
jgi:CBS domain containing-hemolysin-like protein